jgi:hypothetical protein
MVTAAMGAILRSEQPGEQKPARIGMKSNTGPFCDAMIFGVKLHLVYFEDPMRISLCH